MNSSISLDEPRKLVNQLVTKFQASSDIKTIHSVNHQFRALTLARQHRLAQSRDSLQSWIKKVEAAKWEAQRPSDKSEQRHFERVSEIEKERFSLVKSIDELELLQQQANGSISLCQKQLDELTRAAEELQLPLMNQEQYFVRVIRRLQFEMFRSLGIEWLDLGVSDQSLPLKCRVKSSKTNDIYTFSFEESSPFFASNYLWDLCDQ